MEQFTQPVEGQNDSQETAATHGSLQVSACAERQLGDSLVIECTCDSRQAFCGLVFEDPLVGGQPHQSLDQRTSAGEHFVF